MHSGFLTEVARIVLKQAQGNDLSHVCVVLPSRRAGVFLRRQLSAEAGSALWAPAILTIDDLMQRLSGVQVPDRQALLIALYRLHCEREGADAEPLEAFLSWAGTFVADLNDADLSLVDTDALLADLVSIRRMEAWDPTGRQATDLKVRYLQRLSVQAALHGELKQHLVEQGRAWSGLAYRLAAQSVAAYRHLLPYTHFVVAGLNALSAAELAVLRHLQLEGCATFVWDSDRHFLTPEVHEAGQHLRHAMQVLGPGALPVQDLLQTQPCEVSVTGCPNSVTMAREAGRLVAECLARPDAPEPTRLAVVLCDRGLLLPLLHSLLASSGPLNVTMGFPFRASPWYGFVLAWTEMHMHAQRSGKGYYHRHVARLLHHPVVAVSMPHAEQLRELPLRMRRVMLSHSDLMARAEVQADALCQLLFEPWHTPEEMARCIGAFASGALQREAVTADAFQTEFAQVTLSMANQIGNLIGTMPQATVVGAVALLIGQARMAEVPFQGEPLQGIQVMGLLETRTLDFDEVIMLSVNEGTLPAERNTQTDLTLDLRKAYQIPDSHWHESVHAYHFYRLMQRARRVHLLYSTDAEGLGSGEPSRYIRQWELERSHNTVWTQKQAQAASRMALPQVPLVAHKDAMVMERLFALAAVGLSPSALNSYRICPFRYYMNYVVGAGEPDELQDHLGAADLGTVVHKALELLYMPYISCDVSAEDIEALIPKVPDAVQQALTSTLQDRPLAERDVLTRHAVLRYVERALHHDLKVATEEGRFHILGIEHKLTTDVDVSVNGSRISVRLRGTLDRIDRMRDGTLRITDHKTGSYTPQKAAKLKVAGADVFEDGTADYSYPFQVLVYTYAAMRNMPAPAIRAGINFLRSTAGQTHPVVFGDHTGGMDAEHTEQWFNDAISPVVTELLNAQVPFSQTTVTANCEYCHLRGLCGR
jgi:hypothetical protein